MRLQILPRIPDEQIAAFYDLYVEAFGPLRTLAAARQVLTADEFTAEMTDPRVDKYVVTDRDGRPVGLTTLTHHLATVPWIEPAYYAARFPEHAARDAIFYLGFTLVHPDAQGGRVFALTVAHLVRRLTEVRAVVAYDICAHNDTVRHLGAGLARAQQTAADVTVSSVDVQTYYTVEYHGPR